jgi:hypothetical protein
LAPILKKTAKKPPKVKKTYQTTLGSEKMWFNVIKNAARNRAYQSFIRSFILYDRVSLRPEHIEEADRPEGAEVRWYTPNRAWYWEFVKERPSSMTEVTLRTTIKEHEPYLVFVESAAMEEYPDNWVMYKHAVRQNARTIREKLEKIFKDNGLVEVEEEPTIPRAVFRQIREIFIEFADTIATKTNEALPPMQGRGRIRRAIRELFGYKPTIMRIGKHYEENKKNRRGGNIHRELLQAVYVPFITNVRMSPYHFTFEHIANLYAHFREVMMQELKGDTDEEIFNSILNYDLEDVYLLTLKIWEEKEEDRMLFLQNLPIDRILN